VEKLKNTFFQNQSILLREIILRLCSEHGLATVDIVGDRCRRGRVAGVEQISSSKVQFPARYPLRML
jgi:hypothetical protein